MYVISKKAYVKLVTDEFSSLGVFSCMYSTHDDVI